MNTMPGGINRPTRPGCPACGGTITSSLPHCASPHCPWRHCTTMGCNHIFDIRGHIMKAKGDGS